MRRQRIFYRFIYLFSFAKSLESLWMFSCILVWESNSRFEEQKKKKSRCAMCYVVSWEIFFILRLPCDAHYLSNASMRRTLHLCRPTRAITFYNKGVPRAEWQVRTWHATILLFTMETFYLCNEVVCALCVVNVYL